MTKIYLDDFARKGLRTLMIASKVISEEEYEDFSRRYYLAQTSQFDREKEIEAVASELECGLELLGSTAIEDKL